MDVLSAIVLGLVQGLTEFLPVSSSGHLVMAQALMGARPAGGIVFEVAVHVATLVAIVIFYHKRVASLAIGTLTGDGSSLRYTGKLIVATLPVIAVALMARAFIEALFESPVIAGLMLLVTGFIVWTTRYTITKGEAAEPTWRGALIIGCAQAFAILPGISRSGTTLATALFLGMSPLAAAEFSFLMGLIAISGAAVLLAPDIAGASPELLSSIWIGGFAALVSGLLALFAFVWLLKTKRFFNFAWYAWGIGSAFLLWLTLR